MLANAISAPLVTGISKGIAKQKIVSYHLYAEQYLNNYITTQRALGNDPGFRAVTLVKNKDNYYALKFEYVDNGLTLGKIPFPTPARDSGIDMVRISELSMDLFDDSGALVQRNANASSAAPYIEAMVIRTLAKYMAGNAVESYLFEESSGDTFDSISNPRPGTKNGNEAPTVQKPKKQYNFVMSFGGKNAETGLWGRDEK